MPDQNTAFLATPNLELHIAVCDMEVETEIKAKQVIEQALKAKHPGRKFLLACKCAIAYTILWDQE